jgi:methyl-accepting chemotaxis protein
MFTMNCLSSGKTSYLCLSEVLRAHWMSILSGGIMGAVIWVCLTHRVAGPLYRVERIIDKMALGDLDFNMKLRKHDEGKDVAEAVNRLKNILVSNIDSMRELSDSIDKNLKKSSIAIQDGEGDVQALIYQTRAINGQLRQILDSYTVNRDSGNKRG